jgi:hypothetical protein
MLSFALCKRNYHGDPTALLFTAHSRGIKMPLIVPEFDTERQRQLIAPAHFPLELPQ